MNAGADAAMARGAPPWPCSAHRQQHRTMEVRGAAARPGACVQGVWDVGLLPRCLTGPQWASGPFKKTGRSSPRIVMGRSCSIEWESRTEDGPSC